MTGRGLHGRRVAVLMVVAVLALDVFLAVLLATAPTGMGGPFVSDPLALPGILIPGLGIALHVAGLAWMIRIVRADPEAHAPHWRFERS